MLRKGQELFWVAAYYIISQKIKERNDPNRLPYSLPGTLERNQLSQILLHLLLSSDLHGGQSYIIIYTLWIRKLSLQKDK